MAQFFSGIPNLPDLTHPNELLKFGETLIHGLLILAILSLVLGIVIAVINRSNQTKFESVSLLENLQALQVKYLRGIQIIPHIILILVLLIGGFFLGSTLANRYHNWEQAKIAKIATTVAGERLEQNAPRIRYTVEEPYTDYRYIDNKMVEFPAKRTVDRYMSLASSQINVTLDQTTSPDTKQWIYSVDFDGEYQVVNRLKGISEFFLEILPPYGYLILQDFRVEQDGKPLVQINPGDYGFPFRLSPGQKTRFHVHYQAQGAPRWVYHPGEQLLSDFRLNVQANFPQAEFAGAIPTVTQEGGGNRQLTWIFEGNVSVRNPFGVFTETTSLRNTGTLPRLLLLAPLLFLWWISLMYLSLPLRLKDVAIAGGIFFACLLTLTYTSRVMNANLAWTLISGIWLALIWGLGINRQTALAAIICTIAGGILPIFGLLVPYSGLTLSLAALLSGSWLAVRHWYKLYT